MVTEGSTQIEVPLLNRFVPAMMFFVVAVVELTRVPLIISIYRSHSFLWQIFGSIFLLICVFNAWSRTALITAMIGIFTLIFAFIKDRGGKIYSSCWS